MPPLRAVWHFFLGLLETLVRRLFGRSRNPEWPFLFETVLAGMRRNFSWFGRIPVAQLRRFNEGLARAQPFKHPVERERGSVEGVVVETFRPPSPKSDGVVLYLHGGSYIMGSTATHAELIGRLALEGSFRVKSVEYRLAPEASIPDAVEDVLKVHRSLIEEGETVAWAGDSSGGGLAFLAAIRARDSGAALPRALAAICPWVDLRCEGGSYEQNEGTDWGTSTVLRAQARIAAGGLDLADPSISPLFADLSGLPPALIHVGEDELVRDAVIAFGEALEGAGSQVELVRWPHMVHNFHLFADFHPSAGQATVELAAFLREQLR